MYRARFHEELGHLCKTVGEQRIRLVSAIAQYHQALGSYPPDHILSSNPLTVEPVTNQLFYELVGMRKMAGDDAYFPSGSSVLMSAKVLKKFFGTVRFRNSSEDAAAVKQFIDPSMDPLIDLNDRPESILVLTHWPSWPGFHWDVMREIEITSWRYNASAPLHNPGSYDLWIELRTPDTNIVIGNW